MTHMPSINGAFCNPQGGLVSNIAIVVVIR